MKIELVLGLLPVAFLIGWALSRLFSGSRSKYENRDRRGFCHDEKEGLFILRPIPWSSFPYPRPLPVFLFVTDTIIYADIIMVSNVDSGKWSYVVYLHDYYLGDVESINASIENKTVPIEMPSGITFCAKLSKFERCEVEGHAKYQMYIDLPDEDLGG